MVCCRDVGKQLEGGFPRGESVSLPGGGVTKASAMKNLRWQVGMRCSQQPGEQISESPLGQRALANLLPPCSVTEIRGWQQPWEKEAAPRPVL